MPPANDPPSGRARLLYHFGRLQLPGVGLAADGVNAHLGRTFTRYNAKLTGRGETPADWPGYFDGLYAVDWFVCCACLENDRTAWDVLFATRTGRGDHLLIDALRGRAARLYPRDEERRDSAVTEFWSLLIVNEDGRSDAVLERYDGQRPLVPWLIRVFQNMHVTRLKAGGKTVALPDDDIALPSPTPEPTEGRWHEAFAAAAREWLDGLSDGDRLLLGLRWRYRVSQRRMAEIYGRHEGTISRRMAALRDQFVEQVGRAMTQQGWTGDDLNGYLLTQMQAVLLDDPRLCHGELARLVQDEGLELPAEDESGDRP